MSSVASQDMAGNKPSGKFDLIGMLATLIGGSLASIAVGLVLYAIESILSFGIPLVFPIIIGIVTGIATVRLGSKYGRCRNTFLAIAVAVIAGLSGWATGHVADYVRFRFDGYNSILSEYPNATPQEIDHAVGLYLQTRTGQSGLLGFLLLKASSDSLEITHISGGMVLPAMKLSGAGLIAYWLIELLIIAGIAGISNRDYAKAPYCDNCNTWRKHTTAVFGTDANLAATVDQLDQKNIPAALELFDENGKGNLTRLQIEYCPGCYDSQFAKLVVVKDAGPKKWTETLAWSAKLEPRHVRQIVERAK